jgi:hypothetical protein
MWMLWSFKAGVIRLGAVKHVLSLRPCVEMQSAVVVPLSGISGYVRAFRCFGQPAGNLFDIRKSLNCISSFPLPPSDKLAFLSPKTLPVRRIRGRNIEASGQFLDLGLALVADSAGEEQAPEQWLKKPVTEQKLRVSQLQEHSSRQASRSQEKVWKRSQSLQLQTQKPGRKTESGRPKGPVEKHRMADVEGNQAGKQNQGKRKRKNQGPESEWRGRLDWCTKQKDVLGALSLIDEGLNEGYRFLVRNFNQVLYLCAAAASGEITSAVEAEGAEAPGVPKLSEVSPAPDSGVRDSEMDGGSTDAESAEALVRLGIQKGWELYELMQKVRKGGCPFVFMTGFWLLLS